MKLFAFILLVFSFVFSTTLYAQEESSFEILVTPGDSLRQTGDLAAAITAYKRVLLLATFMRKMIRV